MRYHLDFSSSIRTVVRRRGGLRCGQAGNFLRC